MIPPSFPTADAFNNLDHLLRIEELYLLQRVAQKINSILDPDILLDEVVGDVANTFGYTRLAVLLKDETLDDELELYIAAGWTGEMCLKGTRFKIGKDGMGGHAAATGETHYAPDVRKNPYYIVGEADTRSEVDIPLMVRGELIGIFNVQHTEIDAFPPERIRLLEALAGHVATAVSNARMFDRERLEKERMVKELEEARAIQFGLFPYDCPRVENFEISGVCVPCREVGGDWFDYIPLKDGRLGVVLADVSGKGMGAALLMSSTRSVLRLYAEDESSPRKVLTKVNKTLLSDFPAAKFVTLVYAVIDPKKRTVNIANAGHLPPVLSDENGARFLDTDSGFPLGLMECEYADLKLEMHPGTRLFLYTDGVTEAANMAEEEYGSVRVLDHLGDRENTVESLLSDIKDFAGTVPAADDVTVVMLSVSTSFRL